MEVLSFAAGRSASSAAGARDLPLAWLCALAAVVGFVTGLGAVAYHDLIGFIHNVLFLGRWSVTYNADLFTPRSPWGPMIILVPVLGSLGVTFIVRWVAPEAIGSGVPHVMAAIFHQNGLIRPIEAIAKTLASALAIGSGAPVGREGPIVQIGSALAATMGQVIRMPGSQRISLLVAGAGAGIAATFNAPLGGLLFAMELLTPEVDINSLLSLATAISIATMVGRMNFGTQPPLSVSLSTSSLNVGSASTLALAILLGAIIGLIAAIFIRTLRATEGLFGRIPYPYIRHASGMLLVGLLIYILMGSTGHYYVEGVGYATIQAVLIGNPSGAGFLLTLGFCKLVATSVSLGSGSSGGIFSPTLFFGATLGSAFGAMVSAWAPTLPSNGPLFAIVGMAAMVGSATGAPLAAIVTVFEITRNYGMMLPMIPAVTVALATRHMLSRETVYTATLARHGVPIPNPLRR